MNRLAQITEKPGKLKLTVDDFLLLDRNGAFDAYHKVELIDGEIWIVSPHLTRHGRMVTDLTVEIAIALREMKSPLSPVVDVSTRISDHSLPQPDIALSAFREDGLLPLSEVALVVEVANTTLRTDMGRKLRVYAEAGVPEYWVVDLKGGILHQMWQPEGKAYCQSREVQLGKVMKAETVAGLKVTVPKL